MKFKQATYKRINKKITMKCNGYTQKDKNRICVYFHYYNNDNKPFYIGQGIGNTNINKYDNKNCKGVVKLDLNGNFISDYISAKEAAKSVNGYGTDITKCCRNKRKQYKGYKWIYFEDYYSDIKPNHN